jgi:hypothetical protein
VQVFPQQATWLCAGFREIRALLREGKVIAAQPAIEFAVRA